MPLRFPGSFIKERASKSPSDRAVVATKFAALPWRFGREAVVTAVRDSLRRLQLSDVELYQLHWPGVWGNEAYIDGLADCVDKGLVRAVGVSNYSGEVHAMHCVGRACMAFSKSEPGVVSSGPRRCKHGQLSGRFLLASSPCQVELLRVQALSSPSPSILH